MDLLSAQTREGNYSSLPLCCTSTSAGEMGT